MTVSDPETLGDTVDVTRQAVELVFREEGGRVLASLIASLGGDFDTAEEAVQDAFIAALEHWPVDGVPDRPGAWITTTARRRAIDRIRRARRLVEKEAIAPVARRCGGALERSGRPRVRGGVHPGRPTAAHLHLLSPGAVARGTGGPHAADRGGHPDTGHRARLPGTGADHRAAAGARQAYHPRRRASHTRCRARPNYRSAWPRCCWCCTSSSPRGIANRSARDAADEPHDGGDPARPTAHPAAARRGRGARPAGADAAPRGTATSADSMTPGSWCCSRTRIGHAGIGRPSRRARRCSAGPSGWVPPGPTRSRPPSRWSTTWRRTRRATDWRAIVAAVRAAGAARAVAGRGPQPCRGGVHDRRPGGSPRPCR